VHFLTGGLNAFSAGVNSFTINLYAFHGIALLCDTAVKFPDKGALYSGKSNDLFPGRQLTSGTKAHFFANDEQFI
jgi:hypothetical protein